jgi:hypothetical protein
MKLAGKKGSDWKETCPSGNLSITNFTLTPLTLKYSIVRVVGKFCVPHKT